MAGVGVSQDQFESYFKRADLDHDGRISGAEAVSFFQGSGLSKQVLAQIWMYADQSKSGYLGRQEFFNALKLVTVAQSGRPLTNDIVNQALFGPASFKIPPPRINLNSLPPPTTPAPAPGMPTQNLAYRGGGPPTTNNIPQNQNMNPQQHQQQYYQSAANQQLARPMPQPSQGLPAARPNQSPGMQIPGRPSSGMLAPPNLPGAAGMSPQGSGMSAAGFPGMSPQGSGMSAPGLPSSGGSNDWLGGRASGGMSGPMQIPTQTPTPTPQVPNRASSLSSLDSLLMSTQSGIKDSSANAKSDPFAAFQIGAKKTSASPAASSAIVSSSGQTPAATASVSSSMVPVSPGTQTSLSSSRSLDSLQSAYVKQPMGTQAPAASQVSSSAVSPGISAASNGVTSDQSQPPWPKMTTPGIQKYTKVFMEVDTDRDGKISGLEARNLFLSWRLPREILKQVWDLADQDNDSMLSLREFCISLYLMERYREGRTLPATLPNSILVDETLTRMTGLPNSAQGNAAWGPASGVGFRPVQGVSASQATGTTSGLRPVIQSSPQTDGAMQFHQQKSSPLAVDSSQANQLGEIGQDLLHPSPLETNDTENKAEKVQKIYLDSREKLEYYRTKMQELVLYKSRCDNRLNEIIERASADKREAEALGKKYEEKYKQVAELNSKLTIEEAKFREYQERKMELQQAITNMEQGGSADGILQVRADRIQSDFEELLKALSERCKKHGVEVKSAAVIELPKGWQPGIQEGAAVWDEEWDKFEDEGLLFDKETTADAGNATASPKSILLQNGTYPHDEEFSPDSSSIAENNSENQFGKGERTFDSEYGYTHSEDDSARSPHGSPTHHATPSSPSYSDVFAKSSEADTDFQRGFDDHGWGNFDGTDDVDSVWGFNSKDLGHDQHTDQLFESTGFGSSPRTDSPQGYNAYNKKSTFNFADSVPGTPYSKSVNSPRYSEAGDNLFDNSSRFDSFSMNGSSRFSPPRETLARFDSISSSRGDFGHNRGFTSFDDSDPFGSSGPFKVSSETPKKGSDNWSSF